MKLNYKKLGNYIKLVNERNSDLKVSTLLGVNMTKNYMPTIANMTSLDLSKYKIIRKDRFACNIMHVGRDERLPVSLFETDEPALVSPAYITFEVKDSKKLLPKFLMMIFQKPEFDRLTWYVSDSSVRGGLEWERFCEIEVPIPDDIEIQRSVVATYNGLLKNQGGFENSLSDLQLICDSFMENLAKKKDLKTLGEHIQQSEDENYGLPLNKVRGISIHKKLIKPKANMTDVELSGYKLLKKGQFVFNPNTSRNGDKLAIALSDKEDYIVSTIYTVFEISNMEKLLPEFLLLWFTRSEFDRYARFHSWGSARETFNWEDMCAVKLPIPDIEVQKSIVAIHHALESRKRINESLKSMITPLCQILMRGVVDKLTTN